jgi:hypothetical protein
VIQSESELLNELPRTFWRRFDPALAKAEDTGQSQEIQWERVSRRQLRAIGREANECCPKSYRFTVTTRRRRGKSLLVIEPHPILGPSR